MGRPKLEDAKDTRTLILQATVELLADRGFSGMSIRDISEKLGISKAAVFYHFPSKEAIVEALVSPAIDHLNTFINSSNAAHESSEKVILGLIETMSSPNGATLGFAFLHDPAFGPDTSIGAAIIESKNNLAKLIAGNGASEVRVLRAWASIAAVETLATKLAERDPSRSTTEAIDIKKLMVETALGALGTD